MHEIHQPTSDFILPFYYRASRYIEITCTLLSKGLIDFSEAICKIRTELYALHAQVYHLVLPLDRKISRFNHQIEMSSKVSVSIFVFFHAFHLYIANF